MTEHTQLTRDDLATMSADEINTARSQGRLNEVMGIPTPVAPERPTRDDLKGMTDEQISNALREGRLEHIFRPGPARRDAPTETEDTTSEENN